MTTLVACGSAGPATAVWYDLDTVTAEVLAILRLTDVDVDAERIATLVPVAAAYIDMEVDRPEAILGPPPPPLVAEGLRTATIVLYRHKDAQFDTLHDALAPVRMLVGPYKQRTGVA